MKSIKIIALVCVLTLVNRLGAQELYDSDDTDTRERYFEVSYYVSKGFF